MMNEKAKIALKKIRIRRDVTAKEYDFLYVFEGFEKVGLVKRIFGKRYSDVLANLKIGISTKQWYMWIDSKKGRLMIGKKYLMNGSKMNLYLDVCHELVHIRQHRQGKELWDKDYEYVDRPTEVEAYRVCVGEARRLGMTKKQIASYLYMKWLSNKHFERLLKAVNV